MGMGDAGVTWKEYALTGRPDFLNYLHRGDVSWKGLWSFYRETPADTGAVVKLIRLFHLFQCRDFESAGSVLDRDGEEYEALRSWAAFAVASQEVLPESLLCESLSDMLSNSLVSALYFEAVFSVYLEASLEHAFHAEAAQPEERQTADGQALLTGKLRYRLPDLPALPNNGARHEGALLAVHEGSYALWDSAYSQALGEELEGWEDEGGEG